MRSTASTKRASSSVESELPPRTERAPIRTTVASRSRTPNAAPQPASWACRRVARRCSGVCGASGSGNRSASVRPTAPITSTAAHPPKQCRSTRPSSVCKTLNFRLRPPHDGHSARWPLPERCTPSKRASNRSSPDAAWRTGTFNGTPSGSRALRRETVAHVDACGSRRDRHGRRTSSNPKCPSFHLTGPVDLRVAEGRADTAQAPSRRRQPGLARSLLVRSNQQALAASRASSRAGALC